jgi:hypothetical protein
MLRTGGTGIVALAAAYAIAVLATSAGVLGAVLLLPFQVSVLGMPSTAPLPPTNLLDNRDDGFQRGRTGCFWVQCVAYP